MEEKTEVTFDVTNLVKTKNIVSMYQNGAFLVCMTDLGQEFRQAIPAGKILNKKGDDWILEDLNIRG